MRVRFLTSFAALALLVVAPSMAQLPGESEAPRPAAVAEATVTTPAPASPDAVIGDVEPPDPAATEAETLAAESAAVQAPMEPQVAESATATPTVETTPAEPQTAASPEGGSELPRTASPLALIALLGAGSAGSALGLRFARRRR